MNDNIHMRESTNLLSMNSNNDKYLEITSRHPRDQKTGNLNSRAWIQKEEITESYQDIAELLVIGGVIWSNNNTGDSFVNNHGVKTPYACWRLIARCKK